MTETRLVPMKMSLFEEVAGGRLISVRAYTRNGAEITACCCAYRDAPAAIARDYHDDVSTQSRTALISLFLFARRIDAMAVILPISLRFRG